MIDDLMLLSGNDIPFPQAQVTIHQPRLKEIAYITENNFWFGCQILKFNKNLLEQKDKIDLSNYSNFDIIMKMVREKDFQARKAYTNLMSILTLIFPTKNISLKQTAIQLRDVQTQEVNEINNENFNIFKDILIKMFCLSQSERQYDPSGDLAKKIADKLARGRAKRAKLASNEDKDITIFTRYISILAVGEQKDINSLMNYTIYQLMDEFNRYNLKMKYDSWERAKIAGATGMQDPENWLKDIHNTQNDNYLENIPKT